MFKDHQQAIQAHQELANDEFEFLLSKFKEEEPWDEFLKRVGDEAQGENVPEGWVQSTFLLAVEEDTVVGRSSIRHELNDYLYNFSGHIGYAVRPDYRNEGIGTLILEQSLLITDDLGIASVLMTCNDKNVASARIIEKFGGVLENKVEREGKLIRRYWIQRNLSS